MTERRRRLIDSVLALRQPELTVLAERLKSYGHDKYKDVEK